MSAKKRGFGTGASTCLCGELEESQLPWLPIVPAVLWLNRTCSCIVSTSVTLVALVLRTPSALSLLAGV